MKQLVGTAERMDEALLAEIRPKIQAGTLIEHDLEKVFMLFGQVCNHSQEIQYEMTSMSQAFQFLLGRESYAAVFVDGACQVYAGQWPTPTVIFSISLKTVMDIIIGNIHSSVAQMNGDINYTGPRHDALAFQRIFELVLDEFI
jgi:putative sterol carrier protein